MRTPETRVPISAVLSIGSDPPILQALSLSRCHPLSARRNSDNPKKKKKKNRLPLELSGPDIHAVHEFLFTLPPTIVAWLSGCNKGVRLLPACWDADKTASVQRDMTISDARVLRPRSNGHDRSRRVAQPQQTFQHGQAERLGVSGAQDLQLGSVSTTHPHHVDQLACPV